MAPSITTPPQITLLCFQSSLLCFCAPFSPCQHLQALLFLLTSPFSVFLSDVIHFANLQIWTFNFLRAVNHIFFSVNIILELVNKTAHIYRDRSFILCSLTEIWSFFPFFSFFVCLFNLFPKPAKKIIAWEWVRLRYIVCFSKAHDVLVSTGPLLKNTAFLDMFNKSKQSNSCCIILHLTWRTCEQRDVLI